MPQEPHMCPLGFTDQLFPTGSHICQIYSYDAEREASLLGFLESGLNNGEKTACFSSKTEDDTLAAYLQEHGLSLPQLIQSKALTKAATSEVYLRDGCFEPERMLGLLRQFYCDAHSEGFSSARVIGEMIPEILSLHGGNRMMEYESRVSMLLREFPLIAVCQYDANVFDGATVMQVLRVHPLMVIRGIVVHNPYFIPPEEYLNQIHIH